MKEEIIHKTCGNRIEDCDCDNPEVTVIEPACKVYNRHHNNAPTEAVFIGRGSEWGNPFIIGRDGDRDDVCDKFESIMEFSPILKAAARADLKGKDLVCFCSPKRCHGDYLIRIANK